MRKKLRVIWPPRKDTGKSLRVSQDTIDEVNDVRARLEAFFSANPKKAPMDFTGLLTNDQVIRALVLLVASVYDLSPTQDESGDDQ